MPEYMQLNPVLDLGPTVRGQILYFFGARHSNNPNDAQFGQLRQSWTSFLKAATGERLVLTEAAARETPATYEDAIRQYGEVGAVQWLAREANVEAMCPEPDATQQRKMLCATWDSHLVAYTFIIQNLAGWFRQTTHRSTFSEAVSRSVQREARFTDAYGFTPDDAWFQKQHQELFGDQQLEDKHFLDVIADPRKTGTPVNQVVSSRTAMRNTYIQERIAKAWEASKSIFIVYGMGHLVALETPLRNMVEL